MLIEIGQRIGTLETILLIVVTGVVGASMARSQGIRVLGRVQDELAAGRMPGDSLIDGIMILLASALLVTPGVLTDVFGFLCLLPAFRSLVKREMVRRFEQAVAENRVHVHVETSGFSGMSGFPGPDVGEIGGEGPILDVTPDASERGDRRD